jgi:hypothetical protein
MFYYTWPVIKKSIKMGFSKESYGENLSTLRLSVEYVKRATHILRNMNKFTWMGHDWGDRLWSTILRDTQCYQPTRPIGS